MPNKREQIALQFAMISKAIFKGFYPCGVGALNKCFEILLVHDEADGRGPKNVTTSRAPLLPLGHWQEGTASFFTRGDSNRFKCAFHIVHTYTPRDFAPTTSTYVPLSAGVIVL